jgi:DNA-binding MarR family transcriptional regulator
MEHQGRSGSRAAPAARDVELASRALLEVSVAAMASVESRVPPSQLRALLALRSVQPARLADLAALLGTGTAASSRLVDRLVLAGLVDRRQRTVNRREVDLTLTSVGEEVLHALTVRRTEAIHTVLRRMPSADRAALLQGLLAFAAHADTTAGAGTHGIPLWPA